ncbi:hypothetical protein PGT21_032902 [Puccinia graminis f. sp. tritici]|uniref:Uncharacterized protein n=1 Tax=Puccinia graminis f. sp. tritici TaxID=56615 RepID=A0A5B0P1S0_PUCGR|nr:hypothetical protein PGT21_032902 [Puccinia graminis f. sp. tritici]
MAARTSRPRSKKLKTKHAPTSNSEDEDKKPIGRPARRAKKKVVAKKEESPASASSLSSAESDAKKAQEKEFIPSDDPDEGSPELDSDHIDSDDGDDVPAKTKSKKRKSTATGGSTTGNPKSVVVKNIAPGPTKDQLVSPGLIAGFTMDLLENLAKPECNDREWLIVNDNTYRKALENWKDFVDLLCPKIVECDWTIPQLPAKDLVYRLHRDVRFSSDKTPYKKYFSAGFSRTGRKGPWALYYLQIEPGDKSLVAGGIWCPDKNQLATIRNSIMRNPKPLRDVINHKEFTEMFGKPSGKPGPSERKNIFGHKDELKNCPKMNGVDKSHPDLDLLKLRSIAATKSPLLTSRPLLITRASSLKNAELNEIKQYRFPDEVVMSSSFMDEIAKAVKALSPLVQCLNEMILPQSDDEEEA